MKKITILLLMTVAMNSYGQYTKEKLRDLLCGTDKKTWQVSGININRPEKTITFKTDNTSEVEDQAAKKIQSKWKLQSADNIRWFLDIGEAKYEMIVSYNKKGEQYIKLTHAGNDYEMKLTQTK